MVDEIAANLIRHAAHLVELRERTGRTIALALEPEPYCLLETIDETIALLRAASARPGRGPRAARAHRARPREAEAALRRHLGVCYDVCHAAVEFEDPAGSLEALRRAGIAVPKLQLSAALRIAEVGPETARQLRPFDEPVYLHQVVARRDERLDPPPRPAAGARAPSRRAGAPNGGCISTSRSSSTSCSTSRPPRTSCARSSRCTGSSRSRRTSRSRPTPGTCCRCAIARTASRPAIARELAWVLDQLRGMSWQVALRLGRVSNLPTVWTNTLAGIVLAGGQRPRDPRPCRCWWRCRCSTSPACI